MDMRLPSPIPVEPVEQELEQTLEGLDNTARVFSSDEDEDIDDPEERHSPLFLTRSLSRRADDDKYIPDDTPQPRVGQINIRWSPVLTSLAQLQPNLINTE